MDSIVKVFDRREGKVSMSFHRNCNIKLSIHRIDKKLLVWVRCVRWSPDGNYLAVAQNDKNIKVIDCKNGVYTERMVTIDNEDYHCYGNDRIYFWTFYHS